MIGDDPEVQVARRWSMWVAGALGGSEQQRSAAALAGARTALSGGSEAEAIEAAQTAWNESGQLRSTEQAVGAELADAVAVDQETGVDDTGLEAALLLALRLAADDDSQPATLFELTDGEATIGRNADCDIRLFDSSVSHEHALIAVIGATSRIWDLGSTNGTTVNGRRIEETTELAPGDVIGLGDARLVLELVEQVGPSEVE